MKYFKLTNKMDELISIIIDKDSIEILHSEGKSICLRKSFKRSNTYVIKNFLKEESYIYCYKDIVVGYVINCDDNHDDAFLSCVVCVVDQYTYFIKAAKQRKKLKSALKEFFHETL